MASTQQAKQKNGYWLRAFRGAWLAEQDCRARMSRSIERAEAEKADRVSSQKVGARTAISSSLEDHLSALDGLSAGLGPAVEMLMPPRSLSEAIRHHGDSLLEHLADVTPASVRTAAFVAFPLEEHGRVEATLLPLPS